MARVIPYGEPFNDDERRAIAHLRDKLPDSYSILHNFEIRKNTEYFEVDLAVVGPNEVCLIDVKGTRGDIEVAGSKWYPVGRQPFTSPLLKLRDHAKTIKGLLIDNSTPNLNLDKVHVGATVLLMSPDAYLNDPEGKDRDNVTTLKKCIGFLQDTSRVPAHRSKDIRASHSAILKVLQGCAKATSGTIVFGNWKIVEKLGATDAYSEYRAQNVYAGAGAGTVLLRVYQADAYLEEALRERQRQRITNAYLALSKLPSHPGILGARDFFATEAEDRYVLVTQDVPGRALRLHLQKPQLALTFDQKIRVVRDLLEALAHAHAHSVVHRNVCPDTILMGDDGQARLGSFEFARSGEDRTRTIAQDIVDDLDSAYQAPECFREPAAASAGSDVFSAGLVLYEMFTGQRAFTSMEELVDASAVFADKPSRLQANLPAGFDEWLQGLCQFDVAKRPSAEDALRQLEKLLRTPGSSGSSKSGGNGSSSGGASVAQGEPIDFRNLPAGFCLNDTLVVQERLGKPGAFGVVYKVIDTLGDVTRAIKLILTDKHSTIERLKKEYKALVHLPAHPNVVKVIHAGTLANIGTPYILFDYIDGFDVYEMIAQRALSLTDAWTLGEQVAAGLVHLHNNEVFHCDIKPRNLLWTNEGVRIIDFNVSFWAQDGEAQAGGSRKYLPPDYTFPQTPAQADLIDRDLYALGISLYEAITGDYPWVDVSRPPIDEKPGDPRQISSLADLSPKVVEVLLKAIAPKRMDRFGSAEELLQAIIGVKQLRVVEVRLPVLPPTALLRPKSGESIPPNTNPFVDYLLTLYSQSRKSNSGTRGLSDWGAELYVDTALDRELTPPVLDGEFRLVVITGNAGDGKTAFLQRLESAAEQRGATIARNARGNGSTFTLSGRRFATNHDGSQDEGDRVNDDVLMSFLEPFKGKNGERWPDRETRLIAINEGRLIDFLDNHEREFGALGPIVREGLTGTGPRDGVAVVNLNLRSVVASDKATNGSVMRRLLARLTTKEYWQPCETCDLRHKCYVSHNARTLQDQTAGPQVIERLEALYTLTSLRGRLHITLRDLGSALAFMIAGTHNCTEIHELYSSGKREEILNNFYFNSWMGGENGTADRLLTLLREIDVGAATEARLDRRADFLQPNETASLLEFENRDTYDDDLLKKLHGDLPRDHSGKPTADHFRGHRRYVSMLRRKVFFEQRGDGWRRMLPYRSADTILQLIRGEMKTNVVLQQLINAINRGEGLSNPVRLMGQLALQVRKVPNGTIRSYRLFPADHFELALRGPATPPQFVEYQPAGLGLRYRGGLSDLAELEVNLDIFEMLWRLDQGYRPTVEELQGYYLSLNIFKNVLGSAPYRELLLTTSGLDFFRIERKADSRLRMQYVGGEVV